MLMDFRRKTLRKIPLNFRKTLRQETHDPVGANVNEPMETLEKSNHAAWLKGGGARCNVPAQLRHPVHRFVLLGPPGVGKGSQAELLGQHFGACHLSTGDVCRAAKMLNPCEMTSSMRSALHQMVRGELVCDETMLALVAERAHCLECGGGFVLDGFPRTVAQAEALEGLLASLHCPLTAVLSYELPLDQIVARLGGRRTCLSCQAVFHMESRPAKCEGVCDFCGGSLVQREDDRPDAIRMRMKEYLEKTTPVAEFYRQKGLLVSIAAQGSPEETFQRTMTAMTPREKTPACSK